MTLHTPLACMSGRILGGRSKEEAIKYVVKNGWHGWKSDECDVRAFGMSRFASNSTVSIARMAQARIWNPVKGKVITAVGLHVE